MHKVVLTHRLHEAGMALLEEGRVSAAITDTGHPKAMLPELIVKSSPRRITDQVRVSLVPAFAGMTYRMEASWQRKTSIPW
jgi:hypothetical protein